MMVAATSWSRAVRNTMARGAGASLASAVALAACSAKETGSPLAGINAVSHWAWGDEDARRDRLSWKYTGVGALTHLAASALWAYCFERLFASRRRTVTLPRLLGESAAMSAIACAVDYTVTPKRFTPGYELRLSRPSLFATYVAFAAGLVVGSLLVDRTEITDARS